MYKSINRSKIYEIFSTLFQHVFEMFGEKRKYLWLLIFQLQ